MAGKWRPGSCSWLLVLLALAIGCRGQPSAAPPDTARIDRLLGLMRARLALMPEVARWKWHNKRPINDPVRERELLDRLAERGPGRGLSPSLVRSFFAAQIEAAKLVQQADFDRWRGGGEAPGPGGADLTSLRARIDQLNAELIDALAEVGSFPLEPQARATLERRAADLLDGQGLAAVRATALRPLLALPPD